MTFELGFLESALKEWRKLDPVVRQRFKKKLLERLGRRDRNEVYSSAERRGGGPIVEDD